MGIIIMLIICSLVLTVISTQLFCRKEDGKKQILFFCLFWFSFNLFILSVVKYYLGYKWENIIDSFWDVQHITYVHYSIPLLIIGLVVCVVLKFIFKDKTIKFIKIDNSSFVLSMFITYFLVRDISNRTYIVGYLCHIALFLITLFCYRKKEVLPNNYNNRKRILLISCPICAWLILFSLATPVELFMNNAEDFSLSFWTFFSKLIFFSFVTLLVIVILEGVYLIDLHVDLLAVFFSGIVLVSYLQGMFFNGKMNQLDGVQQVWNFGTVIGNAIIWIFLILGITIFFILKRQLIIKIMRYACLYLMIIQLVTIIFSVAISDAIGTKYQNALTTENFTQIGEKNNIIVFVLDKFDGSIIDDIITQDSEFLQPLEDFVYYPNATSEHCPTENSVPFLLTGAKWNPETEQHYPTYAYHENSLINMLYKSNYALDIYTDPIYVDESMMDKIENYRNDIQKNCNGYDLFCMMNIWARYRFSPFIIKNYYFYYTYELDSLLIDESLYSIHNDYKIYQQLMNKHLRVSDRECEGTFKFIHMKGAHPPFNFTDELQYIKYEDRRADEMGDGISQAKGSLKVVYEYLNQMKKLGKYDDSTIIITADHGYTYEMVDSEMNAVNITYPIMFVKQGMENAGESKVSFAPTCQEDIVNFLYQKLQSENATFCKYGDADERLRYTIVETTSDYTRFEITGDVRNLANWKVTDFGKRIDR